MDFEPSQIKAMELVLNTNLAIIQGPPGTGKTFVGSKIVDMLLISKKNYKSFEGPIFLICHSNHALDQFLRHILISTQKVIRLGSQSKDPNLAK